MNTYEHEVKPANMQLRKFQMFSEYRKTGLSISNSSCPLLSMQAYHAFISAMFKAYL